MKTFERIPFLTGLITVIHFAVTGLLLRTNFFGIDQSDVLARMMFRSNHLYILFAGLLNLVIYTTLRINQKPHWLLKFSIGLIIIATLGLNISFYIDPITHSLQRNMTRLSVYGCFGGTVSYLLYLHFSKVIETWKK